MLSETLFIKGKRMTEVKRLYFLTFVYLHSDDSIHVNLTDESRGGWDIWKAVTRVHSSELCSYE